MTNARTYLYLLSALLPGASEAWVVAPRTTRTKAAPDASSTAAACAAAAPTAVTRPSLPTAAMMARRRRSSTLRARYGIEPIEGDDGCDDEEECEINWDLLPGWDEEPDNSDESKIKTDDNAKTADASADASPAKVGAVATTMGQQAMGSFQSARLNLEMNWQVAECGVDEDRCEDFCPDCAGAGKITCRFCRGTKMLFMDGEFRSCPICEEGKEQCHSCHGTGAIAPWASTMEEHFKNLKP